MQSFSLTKPFDRLLFVITLVMIFALSARTPADTDMMWALRAGQETWEQGAPYVVDTLSYTRAGQHWNSHSWLFDLLLYAFYAAFHYYGITLLTSLLAAATFALLWLQLRGPALFRSLLLLFTGVVIAPMWTHRPQMVSMLLLSLTFFLLSSFKKQPRNWILFLFPPIMALWANLHAGYTLGLLAIALLITGELLDRILFINTQNALPWFQIRKLIFMWIACALAALLTPHGFATWLVVTETMGMAANNIIQEWLSPNFHEVHFLPFLFSVLLMMAGFAWSKERHGGWVWLRVMAFTYFAFSSARHIGPYGIAAAPILAELLWPAMEEWAAAVSAWFSALPGPRAEKIRRTLQKANQPAARENKALNLMLAAVMALAAAGKLVYAANPVLLEGYTIPYNFPVKAMAWLRENKPAGNLFNDYNIGGVLTWLLPEYPVYVDPRADLYGDAFLMEAWDLLDGKGDWETTARTWEIGPVLIPSDSQLAQQLHYSSQWQWIMEDQGYDLFIKN